jgi:uncharacterized protein with GYD domain
MIIEREVRNMTNFIQLKKYVESEIKSIRKTDTKQDVEKALDRAFGAVMFYIYCNHDDCNKIVAWWTTKRDQFWELKRKAPAEKK